MKCGEGHSTHECKKPRTIPPKCANCGKEHLSISRRCEQNPNNPRNKKEDKTSKSSNPWHRNGGTENERKPKQQEEAAAELHKELGAMLADFVQCKSTDEQQRNFIQRSKRIIEIFKA